MRHDQMTGAVIYLHQQPLGEHLEEAMRNRRGRYELGVDM